MEIASYGCCAVPAKNRRLALVPAVPWTVHPGQAGAGNGTKLKCDCSIKKTCRKSIKMNFPPAEKYRPVKNMENRMACRWSSHAHFWQMSALLLGAFSLAACGSPAPVTPAASAVGPATASAPAAASVTATSQTPPPGMDTVIPRPVSGDPGGRDLPPVCRYRHLCGTCHG